MSFFLVVLVALTVHPLYTNHEFFQKPNWDHHAYITMAEVGPGNYHIAPYAWRPLLPTLAWASPAADQVDFFAITFISLTVSGLLLYQLALSLSDSRVVAAASILGFASIPWTFEFLIWDFWLPDGIQMLFFCSTLWASTTNRIWITPIIAIAASLNKETGVLIGPLVLFASTFVKQRYGHVKLAAICLGISIIVLISLRLVIPSGNSDEVYIQSLSYENQQIAETIGKYSILTNLKRFGLEVRLRDLSFQAFYSYSIGTFGPLVILAFLVMIKAERRFFWYASLPLSLVYLQIMIAENVERLIVAGAPVATLISVKFFQEIENIVGRNGVIYSILALLLMYLMLLEQNFNVHDLSSQILIFTLYCSGLIHLFIRKLRTGIRSTGTD